MTQSGENGDDAKNENRGQWLVGKILDPSNGEFRDEVLYSQIRPLDEEEIDRVLDQFSEKSADEVITELRSGVKQVRGNIQEVDRREFLKKFIGVTATGDLFVSLSKELFEAGNHTLEELTQKPPAYYENYWPNSLADFAHYDLDAAERLLNSSHVDWNRFVRRSTEMLDEVVAGDRVHIHGFFYRGYPPSFFQKVLDCADQAAETTVYFADPVNGYGDASAVELHQDRELLVHQYLLTLPEFEDVLSRDETDFDWEAVPHPGHLKLNRIRALLHSLRFLGTAYYYATETSSIRFQPVSDASKSPLRGRIVQDASYDPKFGAFLRLEKGVVGTSRATQGHLLCDHSTNLSRKEYELHQEFISDFLDQEQQRLRTTSPQPLTSPDIEAYEQKVKTRIRELIKEQRTNGPLAGKDATELRRILSELHLPTPAKNSLASNTEVLSQYRKETSESISSARTVLNRCIEKELNQGIPSKGADQFVVNSLEHPDVARQRTVLNPADNTPEAIYDAVLRYQNLG